MLILTQEASRPDATSSIKVKQGRAGRLSAFLLAGLPSKSGSTGLD